MAKKRASEPANNESSPPELFSIPSDDDVPEIDFFGAEDSPAVAEPAAEPAIEAPKAPRAKKAKVTSTPAPAVVAEVEEAPDTPEPAAEVAPVIEPEPEQPIVAQVPAEPVAAPADPAPKRKAPPAAKSPEPVEVSTDAANAEPYVVLARKYRPQTFGELVGQEAVRDSICGAIATGRIGHAFLLSGPRGTGKTSTARILAKALNCMRSGPRPDPCGECSSCRAISAGSSLDVIEIDAASNTGVDNIRELRSGVVLAPFSRYKVYIIDEVHMLSTGAFNALLKTLEEPPAQVVFVLATTEIHKVPDTIISRCQCFQFRRFTKDELTSQLGHILDTETARRQIEVSADDRLRILDLLARSADGGMRDAQVMLDQILVLGSQRLDFETVRRFLGAVENERLDDFVRMIHQRETAKLLQYVDELSGSGQDLETFTKSLIEESRNLLLLKAAPDAPGLVVGSPERLEECRVLASELPATFLLDLAEQALALAEALKTAANSRFLVELFIIRLTRTRPIDDLDKILDRLKELESRGVGSAGPASPAPAGSAPPRASAMAAEPAAPVAATVASPVARTVAPVAPAPVASAPAPMPAPPAEAQVEAVAAAGIGAVSGPELYAGLLELAKQRQPFLYESLLESRLISVLGNRVEIGVPAHEGFIVLHLNRPDTMKSLQTMAKEITGLDYTFSVKLVEPSAMPPLSETAPLPPRAAEAAGAAAGGGTSQTSQTGQTGQTGPTSQTGPSGQTGAVGDMDSSDEEEATFDVADDAPVAAKVEAAGPASAGPQAAVAPAAEPPRAPAQVASAPTFGYSRDVKGEELRKLLDAREDIREIVDRVKKVFGVDDASFALKIRAA